MAGETAQGTPAHPHRIAWWRSRAGVVAIGFALVAAFYPLREHYGHVLGALPYILLLACPLMHLLTHRGHRHGEGGRHPSADRGDDAR